LGGEAGFEPTMMLVTSIRLRGAKSALREWREVIVCQFQ